MFPLPLSIWYLLQTSRIDWVNTTSGSQKYFIPHPLNLLPTQMRLAESLTQFLLNLLTHLFIFFFFLKIYIHVYSQLWSCDSVSFVQPLRLWRLKHQWKQWEINTLQHTPSIYVQEIHLETSMNFNKHYIQNHLLHCWNI